MKKIYIVDDEPKIGEMFGKLLSRDGYDARTFVSPLVMLETLANEDPPNLILADLQMPDMTGIDLIEKVFAEGYALPIIIMTGNSSIQSAVEAMRLGAFHYLQKPVNLEEMRTLIQKALDIYKEPFAEEPEKKSSSGEPLDVGLLGESEAIQDVNKTVATLGDIPNTTVLIRGETGTGKNLVARTIHANSRFRAGQFVEINCAALPDNLLEAELFGYEKGAFTDARDAKPGLLEIAEGGTIFLDEIDSMSMALQAKLLSFLENRTFRRLGGVQEIKVATRIICATNAGLEEKVAEKAFRSDLFFRINVINIVMPALRTMGDDLLVIARHLLDHFSQSFNRTIDGFSEKAKEKLLQHAWPGNVRELRNVIERAVIFTRGEQIGEEEIMLSQPALFEGSMADEGFFRFRNGGKLEDLEKSYILHTLEHHKASYTDIAKMLGISKKTLWEKRKRYDLDALVKAGSEKE